MTDSTMTIDQARAIIDNCSFYDYTFVVRESEKNGMVLQASYIEPDIVTGKPEVQLTRKWVLTPFMTKSEVVQTAFKCVITSMEHRTREHFRYKGKAIFGPHFDVDALWQVCADKKFDYRTNP
jgi:hypothetical protein